MGEVIDVNKIQNRIFLTLILSILTSIYVGLNYTQFKAITYLQFYL